MPSDALPVKRVAVASDHAGLSLKDLLGKHLRKKGMLFLDLGTDSPESVDYPDFARKVCASLLEGKADVGVLICGTGIGMSIAANRFRGIRAALCHDHFTASFARRHNDANVLCLGARVLGTGLAQEILDTFLETGFEDGRHTKRVNKMDGDRAEK